MIIDSFTSEYFFLSNFYHYPITHEGIQYPTSEHAYQAAKTLAHLDRIRIADLPTPGQAKRYGRNITLRPHWENIKVATMRDILNLKFQDDNLRNALLRTGEAELIEGNYWHDNYWGLCTCQKCYTKGGDKNHLGKLLMAIRSEQREILERRV